MNVFDVSDPTRPAGPIALEMPGNGLGVAASEGIVLVADDSAGLVLVDVANPDAPAIAATVETPGVASAVAIDGSVAFVADGARGLQVIDLGCFAP